MFLLPPICPVACKLPKCVGSLRIEFADMKWFTAAFCPVLMATRVDYGKTGKPRRPKKTRVRLYTAPPFTKPSHPLANHRTLLIAILLTRGKPFFFRKGCL